MIKHESDGRASCSTGSPSLSSPQDVRLREGDNGRDAATFAACVSSSLLRSLHHSAARWTRTILTAPLPRTTIKRRTEHYAAAISLNLDRVPSDCPKRSFETETSSDRS